MIKEQLVPEGLSVDEVCLMSLFYCVCALFRSGSEFP